MQVCWLFKTAGVSSEVGHTAKLLSHLSGHVVNRLLREKFIPNFLMVKNFLKV